MRTPSPLRVIPAFAFLAMLATAGCRKDETAEPDVDSVALVVGSQTITISNNGTVTGGPIAFTRPGAPTITATFRNPAGVMDPVAHGGTFQLNVASSNAGVVGFTRASAFSGTLAGASAGSTQITISLFHIAEAHDDFGPFPVIVNVN